MPPKEYDNAMQERTEGTEGSPPLGDHESASLMSEEPELEPDASGLRLDSVEIRRVENGGYIVRCSKSSPPEVKPEQRRYESKEYAFGTFEPVIAFVQREFQGAPKGGTSVPVPATRAH